ncbi:MAG: translation initiation factor IF-2 [Chloroflexota bacterium]
MSRNPTRRPPRGNRGPSRRGGRPAARPPVNEARTPSTGTRTLERRSVQLPATLSVKDLADILEVNPAQVIKSLLGHGVMANINQSIDHDTASTVATELGFDVQQPTAAAPAVAPAEVQKAKPLSPEEQAAMVERPPVVTIMGHVDHGKTSLLDAIRQTKVTESEAGGITQHIGAYQVEIHGRKITFLDTPGHEAFTSMRARGAQATDIAIIVVAADDGVMPQTMEAIDHARAAHVPLIIAINKVDKADANPDRVKQQLADLGVIVEEWGGDTVAVPVSAKRKTGIDHLLEMILLVAEMGELKANPKRRATGVVIEAKLDKARGPLATILVQSGTLKVGDYVAVGTTYGRVRAMFNDTGKNIKRAEPAFPAEILGLESVPEAGDVVKALANEKAARTMAQTEAQRRQEVASQPGKAAVSLEELFGQIEAGQVKDLNIVLKTDVQGSIDPLRVSLERLSTDRVHVHVIHEGTGNVTESDVLLAMASKAIIVGFNVRSEPGAVRRAETEGVDVRSYSVIYNLIDDVQKALTGMLEPVYRDVLEGRAEVRQVFRVSRTSAIAGSIVSEGKITRGAMAHVVRGGEVLHEGRVGTLRRFKDDVREVLAGFECGISVEGFNSFEEGDIVEAYGKERVS